MATPVQMPKVGISVESCVLTKWHFNVGDTVKKGEVLFTYETDKTTVDEEAQEDGVLLARFYEEGDDVPVMKFVAAIGKKGEDVSAFAPETESAPAPAPAAVTAPAPVAAPAAPVAAAPAAPVAAPAADGDILKISPRARVAAAKAGVDASKAIPTGAEGRIVEKDIDALAATATRAASGSAAFGASGTAMGGRVSVYDTASASGAADVIPAAEYYDEKLTSVRKFIAKTMHESISGMAQLTHNASFDATNILAFRKMVKDKGEKLGLPNITLNDIVLYAVSRVLTRHKYANAHFLGDTMRFFKDANVGMAVDTERGLLVPTLFGANHLSLSQISAKAKELAKKSQEGNIAPDLLKGGTFTVSNLGAFGIETFTPIVNPPQTAILGVNTLVDAVKEENGAIKIYKRMNLSLTYDHRAMDGAPASKFLKDLCDTLENFTLALAL